MAIQAKVGTFAAATTAGNDTVVTGLGFQPKALIVFGTGAASTNAYEAEAIQMFGFATTTSDERSQSYRAVDNVSTSDASRGQGGPGGLIYIPNTAGTAVALRGDVISFDSGGFTIDWPVVDGVARNFSYIALGGDDITNAGCFSMIVSNVTGLIDVTTIGFQPDFVMFATVGAGAFGTNVHAQTTGAKLSVGAANATTDEWAIALNATDAATMSGSSLGAKRYQRTDRCLIGLSSSGSLDFEVEFTAFLSNGVRVNVVDAALASYPVIGLALQGGNYKVGAFSKSTAAAPATNDVTLAFSPAAALLAATSGAASTAINPHATLTFGAVDSSGNEAAQWMDYREVATLPTEANKASVTTKAMRLATGPSTTDAEADGDLTAASNNLRLTWNPNGGTASAEICYVAFGPAASNSTTYTNVVPQTLATSANPTRVVPQSLATITEQVTRDAPQSLATRTTALRDVPQTLAAITTSVRAMSQSLATQATLQRAVPQTLATRTTTTRSFAQSLATIQQGAQRSIGQTLSTSAVLNRNIPQSLATAAYGLIRAVPQSLASITLGNTRAMPQTLATLTANVRTMPQTLSTLLTGTRGVPQTISTQTVSIRSIAQTISTTIDGLARSVPQTISTQTGGVATIPQSLATLATVTRGVVQTVATLATTARAVPQTLATRSSNIRTVGQSLATLQARQRTFPQSLATLATLTRSTPQTLALLRWRVIPQTLAVQKVGIQRTLPQTLATRVTLQRPVPQTAALRATLSRSVLQTLAIRVTNVRSLLQTLSAQLPSSIVTSPATLPPDAVGQTVTIQGTATAWTAGTTFAVSGVTGAAITATSVNAGTQVATLTVTSSTGGNVGTLQFTNNSDASIAYLSVVAADAVQRRSRRGIVWGSVKDRTYRAKLGLGEG